MGKTDFRVFSNGYPRLIKEYSRRALSYETDGLDAIAGISNVVTQSTEGFRFHWGLPAAYLSNALLWKLKNPRRRQGMCRLKQDGGHALCPFPSWAWVGWIGQIDDDKMRPLSSGMVELLSIR